MQSNGDSDREIIHHGSKLSQPLAAALVEDDDEAAEVLETGSTQEKAAVIAEKIVEKIVEVPVEVEKYIKLPQTLKGPLSEAINHARRQGLKVSLNPDKFFD